MADMNELVKVAVDAYHGATKKYSTDQSMELLHKALVEANNGKTSLNYRDIRDGKCVGLFTLVEEILSRTVVEGLQESDFFNTLVEFKNIPAGDKNIFLAEDETTLFSISDIATGTQGLRRQRISGTDEYSLATSRKGVKIYEELDRLLSGRADFNKFIDRVSKSFINRHLTDIYATWQNVSGASDLGGAVYTVSGSYDEDKLLELIAHVEAAAGGVTASVLGTKKAVRNLAPSINSIDANNEMYHQGYYGSFYGTPVLVTPQRHVIGGTDFVLDDNMLTVIATGAKPIKFVYEGSPLIIAGDPMMNADLTQEYMYSEMTGLGFVLAGVNPGIGKYELA